MELSQGQDSVLAASPSEFRFFVSIPLLNVGFGARNSVYLYPHAREK